MTENGQPIFHLVPASIWADVERTGEYQPPSLEAEGFVHFSFADQVRGTAATRFAQMPDLLVVEVDPSRVDAPLRVEDSYGSGTAFPHVYGPIRLDAVVAIHHLDDPMFSGSDPSAPDR